MSLSEFILKEKISAAKLLIKKHIPLVQIAESLGFSSQSHFTKQFKRETGMTPNQYKNN